MRQHHRIIQKEGTLRVVFDEVKRECVDHIRPVFPSLPRQNFAVLNQLSHIAIAPTLPFHPPQAVFIETIIGDGVPVATELPLARNPRAISGRAQVVPEGDLSRVEIPKLHVVSYVVLTGQQLHTRRRADGLRVTVHKANPFPRQLVDSRRGVVGTPITRDAFVADVVCHDQHHIRFRSRHRVEGNRDQQPAEQRNAPSPDCREQFHDGSNHWRFELSYLPSGFSGPLKSGAECSSKENWSAAIGRRTPSGVVISSSNRL